MFGGKIVYIDIKISYIASCVRLIDHLLFSDSFNTTQVSPIA